MSADTTLAVPQGTFELHRHRHDPKSPLRAWDAGDEFILTHLAELDPAEGRHWLVLNDGFGALATALAPHRPSAVSDSVTSHRATGANLERNGFDRELVALVRSTDPVPPQLDVVIIKVPRTLALLEDQLHRLRPSLHDDTLVLGAAMSKNVHNSTLSLFESLVGPTTTSRAVKKARLVFSRFDPSLEIGPSPYPTTYQLDSGHIVVNHANVFSRASLDIGTRLLLAHLPTGLGVARVADLGCGSGVVGLALALANPDASIHFADSSYMAVASAEATMELAFGSDRRWTSAAGDGLESVSDDALDLVVLNPPFHADNARSYDIAWQLFTDARRALRIGGRLLVVGNRHLGYHAKLARLFGKGTVETVAGDPKFVVLSAVRGRP